jgi:hypothetical protein
MRVVDWLVVSLGSRQHPENWPAAMPDSLGTDHVMKVLGRPFEMENLCYVYCLWEERS